MVPSTIQAIQRSPHKTTITTIPMAKIPITTIQMDPILETMDPPLTVHSQVCMPNKVSQILLYVHKHWNFIWELKWTVLSLRPVSTSNGGNFIVIFEWNDFCIEAERYKNDFTQKSHSFTIKFPPVEVKTGPKIATLIIFYLIWCENKA